MFTCHHSHSQSYKCNVLSITSAMIRCVCFKAASSRRLLRATEGKSKSKSVCVKRECVSVREC